MSDISLNTQTEIAQSDKFESWELAYINEVISQENLLAALEKEHPTPFEYEYFPKDALDAKLHNRKEQLESAYEVASRDYVEHKKREPHLENGLTAFGTEQWRAWHKENSKLLSLRIEAWNRSALAGNVWFDYRFNGVHPRSVPHTLKGEGESPLVAYHWIDAKLFRNGARATGRYLKKRSKYGVFAWWL